MLMSLIPCANDVNILLALSGKLLNKDYAQDVIRR